MQPDSTRVSSGAAHRFSLLVTATPPLLHMSQEYMLRPYFLLLAAILCCCVSFMSQAGLFVETYDPLLVCDLKQLTIKVVDASDAVLANSTLALELDEERGPFEIITFMYLRTIADLRAFYVFIFAMMVRLNFEV